MAVRPVGGEFDGVRLARVIERRPAFHAEADGAANGACAMRTIWRAALLGLAAGLAADGHEIGHLRHALVA